MNRLPTPSTPIHPEEHTVLIVDDNPQNLGLIAKYLESYGIDVMVAQDGFSALQKARSGQVALILLDVMMPGLDGFEVCRRLKRQESTQDIPVIFMTVLSDIKDKVKGFQLGASDYITKPIQPAEVLARVSTHLHIQELRQNLQKQNQQLQQMNSALAKRALQLEISQQVGRQITSILEPDILLPAIARLIQTKFNYTSVGIWLLNRTQEALVLQAGEGPGPSFKQGHEIPLTQAENVLVTVCQTRQEYLGESVGHQTEEISGAPQAHAELALPLLMGTKVIGVLDVRTDGMIFDVDDKTVLYTLANQIAVAIRNANLYQCLKQTNVQLEDISLTDPLTGLRNRRYLSKYIDNILAHVHRYYKKDSFTNSADRPESNDVVFFVLDIDHFKVINDTYGHQAGDQVLAQFPKILQRVCRASDILIRWGGEEFLIVGSHFNPPESHLLAERLRKEIESSPFQVGPALSIRMTCSIGFASYPFIPNQQDVLNWEQVIMIADRCLYAAKRSGRNAWVGIMPTERINSHKLFQRIHDNLQELIENHELQLTTSFPDSQRIRFQLARYLDNSAKNFNPNSRYF